MLARLLQNHVLANLAFVLVLLIGFLSYQMLPRQQDPSINFNWLVVTTVLPGASASDVEKRVTDPLEDAIRNIADIKFMSSNSRENISSLLIRFEDIDDRTFDKRVADLRREIQNSEDELPEAAEDSLILEITSANAYPAATIAITALADDENLRLQARSIEKDLKRLTGVSRVDPVALNDPELQVNFDLKELENLGVSPNQIADTVRAFFEDSAAGSLTQNNQSWLVRLVGTHAAPSHLAKRPIIGTNSEVLLGRVAQVERSREKPTKMVRVDGKPAVLMAIMKKDNANTLELVERVRDYLESRKALSNVTGVDLILIDDQTVQTRESIAIMQNNAYIGLLMVLLVTWAFLGSRIALLTSIGIPFILAGTFWILSGIGETLNVTVLLGVVIVLGMLVDDAVVVVESIYYRLQRGVAPLNAALEALKEVGKPVTTAVLTTIAAFMPLMLLPGILGEFMRVIPMVVTIALLISLVEAFWMLPAHVMAAKIKFTNPSRLQKLRESLTHRVQISYVRLLIKALRRPMISLALAIIPFIASIGAISAGMIKMDFFASDPIRLFYVNIEMPSATPVQLTMEKVSEIEAKVRERVLDGEVRAIASYAGQMFTETEPRIGDQYGQILVGLNPKTEDLRTVDAMLNDVRKAVNPLAGSAKISFLRLAGGPPVSKPISVKVRGDNYQELRKAANSLREILAQIPDVIDIQDDASRGRYELTLELNADAVNRAGLNPPDIRRMLRLLVDGEVVASMRDKGEKLEVRVRADPESRPDLETLLNYRLPLQEGGSIPLSELVIQQRHQSLGNIRHYNFRRAITVEADIVEGGIDTVTANNIIQERWTGLASTYPTIDLDFSGELDDIQDSMDAIGTLFIFGIGLMYLILGTQFKSYWQPFMILATVPMAFTGVVLGLMITQNPLSLFTMYGVVALAGIAVNAAIVLISAANTRLDSGMSLLHATLYAARRRVIPILITTLTTVAGLFSLAVGLGGKSLIWGPVATAIVWGLGFSTLLTLFVIPLLFRLSMRRRAKQRRSMNETDNEEAAVS
ncbi:efflux RND transporter permease subunit [Motiliproteus sp. MSK22-1]|uniref:efflux RND transporter permease subunit n=1 Tax=Motiliproteus sp. MSK22-1 TaxID=1897630 RepID=UPI00097579F7|nr:efflux RND transporter permease subunit [Motiliproteus sp. MSK22-1]OMH39770.1 cation transporter [Motiliproteus sp. MSK22-1]